MDFFDSAAQRRPGGLRWPGPESDLSSLTIRVDLGPRISMMKLADSVSDLASVVELGTKWGESLAQSAAAWDVAYVLRRGDRHGLERLLERELGGGPESEELLHFVYDPPPPYRWMSAGHPAWELARDRRAVNIRGQAARPTSIRYENPLELILCGAGSLLMGAILVARLVVIGVANAE